MTPLSWSLLGTTLPNTDYDCAAAGGGVVVAAGNDVVSRSADQGLTWSTGAMPVFASGRGRYLVWDEATGAFIMAVDNSGSGGDGGILTSPDGVTWTARHTTSSFFLPLGLASDGAGSAAVHAFESAYTMRKALGLGAWTTSTIPTPDDFSIPIMGGGGGRMLCMRGQSKVNIKSDDGGATWSTIAYPSGPGGISSAPGGIVHATGGLVMFSGYAGAATWACRTADGSTWTEYDFGDDFTSNTHIAAGDGAEAVIVRQTVAPPEVWQGEPGTSLSTWLVSDPVLDGASFMAMDSTAAYVFYIDGGVTSVARADRSGTPPVTPPFWTGFRNTYEVL